MNIGIQDKNRKAVVGKRWSGCSIGSWRMNRSFTRRLGNYHWNVKGPHFSELHKFFESQYEELDEIIDETAERARSLGGDSLGTLKEFLTETGLKEKPGDDPEAKKMIAHLLADHEAVIRRLRENLKASADTYQDMETSDYLTGLMEGHEKMAWMLRSFKMPA